MRDEWKSPLLLLTPSTPGSLPHWNAGVELEDPGVWPPEANLVLSPAAWPQ